MRFTLLVGSAEFWTHLRADIAAAQASVCVQTLSFEADAAGMGLSEAMRASGAADRRIIVDRFTQHFVSDRWVFSPVNRLDAEHRAEVVGTRDMIAANRAAGVAVTWVNPFGLLYRKAPARNHKKMMLIDDRVAYIGGVNFSDHNFAWHDLMVRIEDPEVVRFLQADFDATWAGRDELSQKTFGALEITLLDGATNETAFGDVLRRIDAAETSVFIESPYLTWPFWGHLKRAVQRGVAVTVLMPAANNRSWMQRYTTWEAARAGVALRYYTPAMTHLKAMLIDERVLLVGSSNFDYFSLRTQQEVLATVTDEALVAEFIARVRDADLARSRAADASDVKRGGAALYGLIRGVGTAVTALARL